MSEATEERLVNLRRSSWGLLDEAAELWGGDVGEILDSLIQGFLATDDGQAVARAESLARLKRLFGENRG